MRLTTMPSIGFRIRRRKHSRNEMILFHPLLRNPASAPGSRLFTACWILLRRILYAHQHHRLTWSVFLSVCGILCSCQRSSMQQSLEMRVCLKLNQKKVLVGLLCDQRLCVCQQHLNNSALCYFVHNRLCLALNLYVCFGSYDIMLLTRQVCLLELIIRDFH